MNGPGVTDTMRPCSMRTMWSALSIAIRKLVVACRPRRTRFASPFTRAARWSSIRSLPSSWPGIAREDGRKRPYDPSSHGYPLASLQDVDARHKAGHDESDSSARPDQRIDRNHPVGCHDQRIDFCFRDRKSVVEGKSVDLVGR